MQKYTRRLKDAPVSHVVAFLILHELTAIVPLIGLFGLFHWVGGGGGGGGSKFVPLDYMLNHFGGRVVDGVRRFEKYFRRKGWFGFGGEGDKDGEKADEATTTDAVMRRWASAESKYRIVVEVGLAYSITKMLLPLRIAVSLWATPWFAGVLARARALRRRKA